MKNLKKISVVLFATLLSLNFTSCIDDGVSDAVDQVYLAQATFLQAQAALKEADAQLQLAKARVEDANAKFRDAQTLNELEAVRNAKALTDNILADAAYLASQRVDLLIRAEKKLEIDLVGLEEDLAIAKSDLAVKLLELAQKIADTENTTANALYLQYATKITSANALETDRVAKIKEIALMNLTVILAGDTESLEFARTQLLNALNTATAKVATEQGKLDDLNARTASDGQQQATDLKADKAELKVKRDSLGVALATEENNVDIAKAEWQKAKADLGDIVAVEGQVAAVEAIIKGHKADSTKAEKAIAKAAANVLALAAPAVVIDTTTAFNGIATAKNAVTTAEGKIGTYAAPSIGDAIIASPTTAYEKVFNAELTELTTGASLDSVQKYLAIPLNADVNASAAAPLVARVAGPESAQNPGFFSVFNLESQYAATSAALTPLPTLVLPATYQSVYDADVLAEAAAQAAYYADPAGVVNTDTAPAGTIDDIGETGTAIPPVKTYMRVQSWNPSGGNFIPATFYPTKYTAADIAAISAGTFPIANLPNENIAANTDMVIWEQNGMGQDIAGGVTTLINGGNNDLFITAAEVDNAVSIPLNNAITTAYYLEVGADDSGTSKLTVLQNARTATLLSKQNLDLFNGVTSTPTTAANTRAKAELDQAYAVLGINPTAGIAGSDLSVLQANYNTVNGAVVTGTVGAYTPFPTAYVGATSTAYYQVWLAEKDVQAKKDALGVDFRPGIVNTFLDEYGNWVAASNLPVTPVTTYTYATGTPYTVGVGTYERFQGPINAAGTIGDVDKLPHVSTGANPNTAYDELRNAYFQMMWAWEDAEALKTVKYTRLFDGNGALIVAPAAAEYSNSKVTTYATADIAGIVKLLVADNAALAVLNAQLADLNIEFGLDRLKFSHELNMYIVDAAPHVPGAGAPTTGAPVSTTLDYIPLYADYLNAVIARNKVRVAISDCETKMDYVQNILNHVNHFLIPTTGDTAVTAADVEAFETAIAALIVTAEANLTAALLAEEQAKVALAKKDIDVDLVTEWIANLEKDLAAINAKLVITYQEAERLHIRITDLLGS